MVNKYINIPIVCIVAALSLLIQKTAMPPYQKETWQFIWSLQFSEQTN